MAVIRNPFRTKLLRMQFDSMVNGYNIRHPDLFRPDGSQKVGSSIAEYFWRGFNGVVPGGGFIDRSSKETFAYACFRAGQEVKKSIKGGCDAEEREDEMELLNRAGLDSHGRQS